MHPQFVYAIIIAELIVLPIWTYYRLRLQKQAFTLHEGSLLLLVASITAAAAVTIIPLPLTKVNFDQRTPVHLVPFVRTWQNIQQHMKAPNDVSTIIVGNLRDNILMFLPIGLFLKLSFRSCSFRFAFLLSLSLSCFFEFCQFIERYFKIYRYVDVDDIVHNTLGGIIGYFLAVLVLRVLLKPSPLPKHPDHP